MANKLLLFKIFPSLDKNRFLLSYPKSGRTWLVNVFTNYICKKENNIDEPLEFIRGLKNDKGKLLKDYHVIFTHGFRLYNTHSEMQKTLFESSLGNRKTCLLIRDPLNVLYSYYIDNHVKEPTKQEFLKFLKADVHGLKIFVDYYNILLPQILDNDKAELFYYEELVKEFPEYRHTFYNLFDYFFPNNVDIDALNWSIDVCDFDVLKTRSQATNRDGVAPRVRQGKVGKKNNELLEQLSEPLVIELKKQMRPEVFTFFNQRYFN